jgi:hypothetical protein
MCFQNSHKLGAINFSSSENLFVGASNKLERHGISCEHVINTDVSGRGDKDFADLITALYFIYHFSLGGYVFVFTESELNIEFILSCTPVYRSRVLNDKLRYSHQEVASYSFLFSSFPQVYSIRIGGIFVQLLFFQ